MGFQTLSFKPQTVGASGSGMFSLWLQLPDFEELTRTSEVGLRVRKQVARGM